MPTAPPPHHAAMPSADIGAVPHQVAESRRDGRHTRRAARAGGRAVALPAVARCDPDRVRRRAGKCPGDLRRRAARRPGRSQPAHLSSARRASCSTASWAKRASTARQGLRHQRGQAFQVRAARQATHSPATERRRSTDVQMVAGPRTHYCEAATHCGYGRNRCPIPPGSVAFDHEDARTSRETPGWFECLSDNPPELHSSDSRSQRGATRASQIPSGLEGRPVADASGVRPRKAERFKMATRLLPRQARAPWQRDA